MAGLEDELESLRLMSARNIRARWIDTEAQRIRYAWKRIALSEIPDHSLSRYFQLQLQGITALSDTLYTTSGEPQSGIQQALLALAEDLLSTYPRYTDRGAYAPAVYHIKFLKLESLRIRECLDQINQSGIDDALARCLAGYFRQVSESTAVSYLALDYFQVFTRRLNELDWHQPAIESELLRQLAAMNFNHLSYLAYLQEKFSAASAGLEASSRLALLQGMVCEIAATPVRHGQIYHADWPALKTMVTDWAAEVKLLLDTQILQERQAVRLSRIEKLALNLPVRYLAFLLKLLVEENVFATDNLSQIFRLTALHYRTKRQTELSPGSLGKNYYSTDQQTAARVQQLLQNMISRINRNFFPVMAAIGAAAYVFQAIQ